MRDETSGNIDNKALISTPTFTRTRTRDTDPQSQTETPAFSPPMDGHAHVQRPRVLRRSTSHVSHMLLNRLQLTALETFDPFLREDAAHELVEG